MLVGGIEYFLFCEIFLLRLGQKEKKNNDKKKSTSPIILLPTEPVH